MIQHEQLESIFKDELHLAGILHESDCHMTTLAAGSRIKFISLDSITPYILYKIINLSPGSHLS